MDICLSNIKVVHFPRLFPSRCKVCVLGRKSTAIRCKYDMIHLVESRDWILGSSNRRDFILQREFAQGSPHSWVMAHPQASISLFRFKILLDKKN